MLGPLTISIVTLRKYLRISLPVGSEKTEEMFRLILSSSAFDLAIPSKPIWLLCGNLLFHTLLLLLHLSHLLHHCNYLFTLFCITNQAIRYTKFFGKVN